MIIKENPKYVATSGYMRVVTDEETITMLIDKYEDLLGVMTYNNDDIDKFADEIKKCTEIIALLRTARSLISS